MQIERKEEGGEGETPHDGTAVQESDILASPKIPEQKAPKRASPNLPLEDSLPNF